MLIQQNMGAIYDGSQRLIAPVLNSTTATKNWAVDEEFILDGNLYKVTTAIPSGSQIIVSGSSANCELADTVTEQIETLSQKEEHTEEIVNTLTNNGTALIPRNEGYVVLAADTWANIANVGTTSYKSYLVISTYNSNRGMWIVTKTTGTSVTSYQIAKENTSTTVSFAMNTAGTIMQMKSSSAMRVAVIFIGNS